MELSPGHKLYPDNVLLWKHGDEIERPSLTELSSRQSPEARLRTRFNELASQWRKDIGHKSSLRRVVFNRAYLSIMLMAADDAKHQKLITRFILEDLKNRGGHWFWALQAMTGASPAQFGDSFDTVRNAWIEWGRKHGYLED